MYSDTPASSGRRDRRPGDAPEPVTSKRLKATGYGLPWPRARRSPTPDVSIVLQQVHVQRRGFTALNRHLGGERREPALPHLDPVGASGQLNNQGPPWIGTGPAFAVDHDLGVARLHADLQRAEGRARRVSFDRDAIGRLGLARVARARQRRLAGNRVRRCRRGGAGAGFGRAVGGSPAASGSIVYLRRRVFPLVNITRSRRGRWPSRSTESRVRRGRAVTAGTCRRNRPPRRRSSHPRRPRSVSD